MTKQKLPYLNQSVSIDIRRGAHDILKDHCRFTGKKQVDVVSLLIVERLSPTICRGRRPSLWERVKRFLFPRFA